MSRRGWAMFAAMGVIWGMPYLLIKIAVGGVSVPVLVLARVAIGTALMLPLALRRRQFAELRGAWGWLAIFAVVEIILPWFALAEAERGISSSLTGLLIAAVPIIVAVLSLMLRGGDRLSTVRWVGLFIGLAGVALLAGPKLVGTGATVGSARSVAEVLFVALCYATGPLIMKAKLSHVPPIVISAASLALATVVYAPLAALSWPAAMPSAKVLVAIAGLALVCTAAAFLIFFSLIGEVGPARASVITYINPAIAVALGVSILGERVTPVMLAAFATILIGSVLATRPARRPAAAASAGSVGHAVSAGLAVSAGTAASTRPAPPAPSAGVAASTRPAPPAPSAGASVACEASVATAPGTAT